jgi:TctA family transporter
MFQHVFQQGPDLVWGLPLSMRMVVVIMFMAVIVRMIVIIVHKNLHPLAGIPARGIIS